MSGLRKKKGVYFNLTLPNQDKTEIKYRSFTVGETKELLVARDLKDPGAFVNTVMETLGAAVEGVDVNNLPMYLTDFIFLQIYIKSGGDKINVRYNCPGEGCDHTMALQLNLDKVEIEFPEGFEETKLIDVGDGMSVKLRVPTFENLRLMGVDADTEGVNILDKIIFSGIECIVDGEDVKTPGVDFSEEELADWINDLDASIFKELENFFQGFPDIVLNTHIKCPKCDHAETHTIRGLDYFLA